MIEVAMNSNDVPVVFIVGAPRSGTSLIFDLVTSHPMIGFCTNYDDLFSSTCIFGIFGRVHKIWFPNSTQNVRKNFTHTSLLAELKLKKSELFRFWGRHLGSDFSHGYLIDTVPSEGVISAITFKLRRAMRLQNTKIICCKLSGPGRVKFLKQVFPSAKFIFVQRDPRAQVLSLLKTAFWIDGSGETKIWWNKEIPREYTKYLDDAVETQSAVALAAAQWHVLTENTRYELDKYLSADEQFAIKYEKLICNPKEITSAIWDFCNIKHTDEELEKVSKYKIMKKSSLNWKTELDFDQIELINKWALRE